MSQIAKIQCRIKSSVSRRSSFANLYHASSLCKATCPTLTRAWLHGLLTMFSTTSLYSCAIDIALRICTCILFVYCLDYFVDMVIFNLNVCFYFDKIEVYDKRNITLACCTVCMYQSHWLCRTISYSCLRHSCDTVLHNQLDWYKLTEQHANIIFCLYTMYQ